MGANPNIFINKENRRIVPPEEEKFFVSAEEFKAIDTAFASKADQTDLNTLDGRVDTLENDLGTAETDIGNLETGKEDTANKTDSFDVINETLFPNWKGVQDYVNEEVPDADQDNFALVENVIYYKNQFGRRTSAGVTFERSAIYAGAFDPITSLVTEPSTSTLTVSKTGAFDENIAKVYHSSETVPTILAGSRPEWLIISGTYLTGLENSNLLRLQYYEVIEISSVIYRDIVVCDILQLPAGGDPLAEFLLIYLLFNENETVDADSVVNNSVAHGSALVPTVLNPTLGAAYVAFRDSFALEFINGSSSLLTNRPHLRIPLDITSVELFGQEITIFALVQFVTGPSTDATRGIIGNRSGNFGFQMNRTTGGEITFRVGTEDGTASSEQTTSGANIILDTWFLIIGRFRYTGTNRQFDIWVKSTDAVRNLTNYHTSDTVGAARSTKYLANITFDTDTTGGTSAKNSRKSQYRVYNKYLDYATEIEPIAFDIDGPNNE